jgi:hypothetical protein
MVYLFRYLYDNDTDSEKHKLMTGLIIMMLKDIYEPLVLKWLY